MTAESTSPRDILRWMADDSHLSAYRLSLTLGRTRNWLTNSYGRDPKLSTVASVASVTGHEVAILDAASGEVVALIDAPERPKDSMGETPES